MPDYGTISNRGRWRESARGANPGALASGARAVGSGTGGGFSVASMQMLKATLQVENANGGTLDVKLQGSPDGSSWTDIASFPTSQVDASLDTAVNKEFSVKSWSQARWAWTVSGATVTFSIDVKTAAPR